MERVHFVSGATGFVGGALVLEILRQTDDRIVCGVRGDNADAVTQRLHQRLRDAAWAYDMVDLYPLIEERISAIPLDIGRENDFGAMRKALRAAQVVMWHCAASLKYKKSNAKELDRDNVRGTRNLVELANVIEADRFNYISTAYVAGDKAGQIDEISVIDSNPSPCNYYEKSKIAAEMIVENELRVPFRILRPGIVVGHSKTRLATSFSGMYGFIRDLIRFRKRTESKLGSMFSHRSVCLVANPESTINFMPIDAVAEVSVKLGLANTEARIFHMTNMSPPKVGHALNVFFSDIAMRKPRFVPNRDYLTSVDDALNKELDFYSSYLSVPKQFSVANGAAIVGEDAFRWDMSEASFRGYYGWFLQYLIEEGANRRLTVNHGSRRNWKKAIA